MTDIANHQLDGTVDDNGEPFELDRLDDVAALSPADDAENVNTGEADDDAAVHDDPEPDASRQPARRPRRGWRRTTPIGVNFDTAGPDSADPDGDVDGPEEATERPARRARRGRRQADTRPGAPEAAADATAADALLDGVAVSVFGELPAAEVRAVTPRKRALRLPSRNKFMRRRRGTAIARTGVAIRTLAISLRRNGPLTLAAILSCTVALCLVGTALVTAAGVDNATQRWRGGVETIVFMDPNASIPAIEAVEAALYGNPDVGRVTIVDKQAAHDEFADMFANTPDLVETVSPEALPVSLRVTPADGVPQERIDAIGEAAADMSGVWQVVYAKDAVRSVLRVSEVIRLALTIGAAVLGTVAVLLTYSACRAAAYARRDELTIMRTVGSPRWLVRLPFIGEGLFAGLAGATIATCGTWVLARTLNTRVADGDALAILANFSVSTAQLWRATLIVYVLGAAGGALGAAFAVSRYVRAGDGTPDSRIGRLLFGLKRRFK